MFLCPAFGRAASFCAGGPVDELEFTDCVTLFQSRINSSNVPADFKIGDSETDPAVVERAARLCTQVEKNFTATGGSGRGCVEMETAFEKRGVQYVATANSEY